MPGESLGYRNNEMAVELGSAAVLEARIDVVRYAVLDADAAAFAGSTTGSGDR